MIAGRGTLAELRKTVLAADKRRGTQMKTGQKICFFLSAFICG
jgi:hypothetical protein